MVQHNITVYIKLSADYFYHAVINTADQFKTSNLPQQPPGTWTADDWHVQILTHPTPTPPPPRPKLCSNALP